jgi:hypothetical protein
MGKQGVLVDGKGKATSLQKLPPSRGAKYLRYYNTRVTRVKEKILTSGRQLLKRAQEVRGLSLGGSRKRKGARAEVRYPVGWVGGSESTVQEKLRTMKSRSALLAAYRKTTSH